VVIHDVAAIIRSVIILRPVRPRLIDDTNTIMELARQKITCRRESTVLINTTATRSTLSQLWFAFAQVLETLTPLILPAGRTLINN
jgi:hypothetical protein